MDEESERPAGFVEALAKGIAILEAFDARHNEMTLSEVARRVNVSPAAARRGLITLIELGYVGQSGKRFHLKPKVMALGSSFYFAARVDEIILPDLRRLVEMFGDASSVGTLNDHNVIYVAHYSQQRARRASAVAGASYPAFATSIGRVLVAGLPDAALDAWLDALEPVPLTARTLIDKAALRDEILTVRQQGYATTVDQLDYGITALAVPIINEEGRTIAAVNSSGYSGMLSPEALVAERLGELRAVAKSIALQLTRFPTLGAVLDN
ncbi:IclR family transcriptional regulator domain-containing protein [Pararhodobacter aggregans]|uniref:IclR family transcriptional regulator n=1 Tax=Pararhodobacter aggregans TaxID=404875 RepID=A0A2T7URM4_9RHOB|nr:IclR family transcriptional regulator C-terminal domain-containing protein [Pararhodobacter aggregans]PTX00423.1 IclR family transcriptional regulator [Pararhodobacter aggregans]PVE47400.1 IclR family transcriptional regulator [Pararhodobacter aggregans]